jgi:hypothetical protein
MYIVEALEVLKDICLSKPRTSISKSDVVVYVMFNDLR